MKKNVIVLFLFLCIGTGSMDAQVIINEDPSVASLIQRHIDQNRMITSLSGWRIQILATTNRRKVEEAEGKFIRNYPTIQVFWEHSKPYYKLKAGAFANKLEATQALNQLKKKYPSAILTKSNVTYSEIMN